MGQISSGGGSSPINLTTVDRLTAQNAAAGLPPSVSHLIALGEDAGTNLLPNISELIFLGHNAGNAAGADRLIGVGFNAMSGGVPNSAGVAGLIVIGADSLKSANLFTGAVLHSGPSVVIGDSIMPLLVKGPRSSVLIGSDIGKVIATQADSQHDNVIIGSDIFGAATTFANQTLNANVIIGAGAYRNTITSNLLIPEQSVIIGADAVAGTGGAGKALRNVAIGYAVASALRGGAENVIIGAQCAQGITSGSSNVLIGGGIVTNGDPTQNVAVGSGIAIVGDRYYNTFLGANMGVGTMTGERNIRIGYGCHGIASALVQDTFLLETFDGGTRRGLIYGDMNGGNVMVGRSVIANRDTPGTNLLKLTDGTVTGVAPTGGGFFYSAAGVAHWVDTGGNDSALARLNFANVFLQDQTIDPGKALFTPRLFSAGALQIGNFVAQPVVIAPNGADALTVSAAGALRLNAYGAGALTSDASGNITATSDERIKRDIRPFTRGLKELRQLSTVLHGYTAESGLDQTKNDYVGFLAQGIEAVMPEAVGRMREVEACRLRKGVKKGSRNPADYDIVYSKDAARTVSDRALLALLVNSVKELSDRLDRFSGHY